jgi:hypothetical protein
MPLAFGAFAGLAGVPLLVARAGHPITASGPSTALVNMIPEWRAVAGPVANTFIFAFTQIYWLLLAIIRPDAALPAATNLVGFMIHVQRLGFAFETLVAAGLDMSPCSASVARKRIRRMAALVFQNNPAPFTALPADLYIMEMPPPPPPPVPGMAAAVVAPHACAPDVTHAPRIGAPS